MDQNNEQNYPWTQEAPAEPVKKGGRFNAAFTQPVFLAICILETIAVVLSVLGTLNGTDLFVFIYGNLVNVINLIITIGAWIIYGKVKKGISPLAGMKLLNGSVKAKFILALVIFGGIPWAYWVAVLVAVISGQPVTFSKIYINFNTERVGIVQAVVLTIFLGLILAALFAGLVVIFAVFYRKVYKFTKSLCLVEEGKAEKVECADVARQWYKVFGILGAIGGGLLFISTIRSFLSIKSDDLLRILTMFTEKDATDLSLYIVPFLITLCGAIGSVTLAVNYLCVSKFIKNNMELLK